LNKNLPHPPSLLLEDKGCKRKIINLIGPSPGGEELG